ncbi:MAG: single-stranded DNA-binding protein [Leucobacter sp.]|jgi:single-strand DNA-binding protein|nr:single-stranded DNA-binding protein [Leucobacter sp.]
MAGETQITVVGNLTADPELRFTNNGVPFASFTIASTPRTFDRQANEWKDGDALFLRATVWREFAEHVANSLTKGMRVVARGNLRQRSYQDKDGNSRTSYELDIDEIGPSLRYATAQVTRAQSRGQGGGFGAQPTGQSDWGQPAAAQANDNPWGSPAAAAGGSQGGFGSGFDDEQPF